MISVKDLTLTLNNTIVLDHVSAEFAEGTVTGLVGRNGSGKTVLMKCICGFFKPDSGSVSVVEIWTSLKTWGLSLRHRAS